MSFVILGVKTNFGKLEESTDPTASANPESKDFAEKSVVKNDIVKDVIPLSILGGTVKDMFESIIAQVNARDHHFSKGQNEYTYNPQVAEDLVGIEKAVFQRVCMGISEFDDIHIFIHNKCNWVGI